MNILLLHGWNYKNYTSLTNSKDAWDNRKHFVNELSKHFNIYKLNFPGFCGAKEEEVPFTLDDYASYVKKYIDENNLKLDYILGYSFGGAVALKLVNKYKINAKLILISPALFRNMNKSTKFIKTPKVFDPLRNLMRTFYLKYITKTNEVRYGTKFLIKSYNNIVRVNMLEDINKINPKNILIIYGKDDNMINPNYQYEHISSKYHKSIKFIDGGHDIANENTSVLIKHILNF